jgi:radical SAM superfamily enzyme YgiQ (UPF0313 family)
VLSLCNVVQKPCYLKKEVLMKVLLINPPFSRAKGIKHIFMPLGISYLGAMLRENDIDVSIYNAELPSEGFSDQTAIHYEEQIEKHNRYGEVLLDDDDIIWKEAEEVLRRVHPDTVGVTVMSAKLPSAFRLIDIVKRVFPECKTVIGGPHATIMPDEILENTKVDFVVRGEGEVTFLELCKMISANSNSFSTIDGLSFRNNGEIVHNKARALESHLSRFPFPAKDLFLDRDKYPSHALANMVTSRGCPFDCAFCGVKNIWTRKVRTRDLDDVINEIVSLRAQYRIPSLSFWDDSFTVNKKYVIELCNKMIEHKIGLFWTCTTRIDLLDKDLLRLMKRAGCSSIDIGLETGSDRMLEIIKKGITMEQFYEGAKLLRKCGMTYTVFLMIGFPDETEADILKTIEFAKDTRASSLCYSTFTPYPGTEAYRRAQELGLMKGEMDWSKISHQSPDNNFCKYVDPERFSELSSELVRAIDEHNKNQSKPFNKAVRLRRSYAGNPRALASKIRGRARDRLT